MPSSHSHPFFRSLASAFRGLWVIFVWERNFRIHVFLALSAVFLAFFFKIARYEWLVLLFVIALVLILEVVNTIVERVIDMAKPRLHPMVRDIKDMMAGAVLLAALASVGVGALIFLPRFFSLMQHSAS